MKPQIYNIFLEACNGALDCLESWNRQVFGNHVKRIMRREMNSRGGINRKTQDEVIDEAHLIIKERWSE